MRPPSGGSDSDNDDGGDDGDHDDDDNDGVEAEEMKKSGTGMRGSSLLQTESLSVLNLPPYRLAALSQVSPCRILSVILVTDCRSRERATTTPSATPTTSTEVGRQ